MADRWGFDIVVVKEGAYVQEVYGTYDSAENAKFAALGFALSDSDSYHRYLVCTLTKEGLVGREHGIGYTQDEARKEVEGTREDVKVAREALAELQDETDAAACQEGVSKND